MSQNQGPQYRSPLHGTPQIPDHPELQPSSGLAGVAFEHLTESCDHACACHEVLRQEDCNRSRHVLRYFHDPGSAEMRAPTKLSVASAVSLKLSSISCAQLYKSDNDAKLAPGVEQTLHELLSMLRIVGTDSGWT